MVSSAIPLWLALDRPAPFLGRLQREWVGWLCLSVSLISVDDGEVDADVRSWAKARKNLSVAVV